MGDAREVGELRARLRESEELSAQVPNSAQLRQSWPDFGLGLSHFRRNLASAWAVVAVIWPWLEPFFGKSLLNLKSCCLLERGAWEVGVLWESEELSAQVPNSAQLRQSRPDYGLVLSHFPGKRP